jgi:alkenylglycerophosphocholine/alkenylglycerophosphoethanolamine hydrolase
MTYYPAIVVVVLAVLDWIAADKKIKALEYFAKPATMLALLWWMWQSVGLGGSMLWFTMGVAFCLAGDVLLMLPIDMFIFGLLAFLLGHIFYIVGLNNSAPYFSLRGGLFIILLAIYAGWLYAKIARGLSSKGKNSLKIPVAIYAFVISLMVYSALMSWSRAAWPTNAAVLVSLGAILFYISDSMLAWDRFVNPISHARLKVMVTYHLGQIGIVLGAMLFTLNR